MKPIPRLLERAFLLVLACGALAAIQLSTAAAAKPHRKKPEPLVDLFTNGRMMRINITVSEEGMATLRKYHWQFGQQFEREDVRATVGDGQTVWTNVAVHLKGAAGSFRDVEQNPAMTLHFDKYVPGQEFHGLAKLSLNNSVQDPTFLSEQLSRELFIQAGVPTPQATQVFVTLNGRDLGLYVLLEGWDKHFLKRHFKRTGGNLYDGGFVKDITEELATNSGDHPMDQNDRIALVAAANEPNLANRLTRLEKVLDLDRFLTFVALDVMLWDWDGYAMNKNNWRLYHDLDKDRLVFMPHGMDQMLWKPEGSILPPMQGLVARALLDIPEMRARYFTRMKELRTNVFKSERLTNRVHEITARFTGRLKESDAQAAKDQASAATDFCEALVRRGLSIDDQLLHPVEPLIFDANGFARLQGWEPKVDFGFPHLSTSPDLHQAKYLEVTTTQGSSIGSWRTKIWLEKGHYRLTGRIMTEGLTADLGDPRGGAGFRLARQRPEKYVLGDSDWHDVSFEFPVDEPLNQVQIACEFRGTSGRARFDLESIRLETLKQKPTETESIAGPKH